MALYWCYYPPCYSHQAMALVMLNDESIKDDCLGNRWYRNFMLSLWRSKLLAAAAVVFKPCRSWHQHGYDFSKDCRRKMFVLKYDRFYCSNEWYNVVWTGKTGLKFPKAKQTLKYVKFCCHNYTTSHASWGICRHRDYQDADRLIKRRMPPNFSESL